MTLHVSSVSRQALVLGVSAILHGAAFFAPGALAGGTAAGTGQAAAVDVELEPADLDSPDEAPPLENAPPLSMQAHPRAVHETTRPRAQAPTRAPSDGRAADVTEGPLPHFALAVPIPPPDARDLTGFADTHDLARPAGAEFSAPGGVDDTTPLSEQAVDTPARLVQSEVPTYPADAQADGVEADVKLEMVVSREGAVESVRAVRRSGYGLDEAAARAARRFRFAPAVKDGRPVRVRVSWTVQFRLR
jgi:TonB family protein